MSRLLGWVVLAALALAVLALIALAALRMAAVGRETQPPTATAPSSGQFVAAADVDIFVQQVGPADGVPVLFIHGLGAWSETWRPTMEALASAGYRCIAIDLPPFGYSRRPANRDYSTVAQARRILGVLDALRIDRAVFVGHSFGGRATVEAAMADPGRVRSLALLSVALGLQDLAPPPEGLVYTLVDTPLVRETMVAAFGTNPMLTRHLLERFTVQRAALTPEQVAVYQRPLNLIGTTPAMGHWLRDFLLSPTRPRSRNPDEYTRLAMPALVIWGDRDPVTPLAEGMHLVRALPNAVLHVMPGIGHLPHVEDGAGVNAALLGFLPR